MKNEFDLDRQYHIEKNIPFLNKHDVKKICKVELVDIRRPKGKNRLLFYGLFPDNNVFKFDLNNTEMQKIIDRYGNIPRDWLDKDIYIKAVEYYNRVTKKHGLQLKVCFEN